MSDSINLLKEGLVDAIDYHKGIKKLRESKVRIPKPPKDYSSNEVKKLRSKLNLSQRQFADLLFVSIKTIQSWESGLRNPQSSALRLLQIVFNKLNYY